MRKNSLLIITAALISALSALAVSARETGTPADAEGSRGAEDAPAVKSEKKNIVRLDIDNGFERYNFYTQYQIGGMTLVRTATGLAGGFQNFPVSRLRFPLDVFTAYANLDLTLADRVTIHYRVRKNITDRAGMMKDSDWIPFPNLLTIYSESPARLNAVITDADLVIRIFTLSFFTLKAAAGYSHEYLYYRCSDVFQKSIFDPGNPPFYISGPRFIRVPGTVITYEVQYHMFTLSLLPVFNILGVAEIVPGLRVSPYLKARDIDDHRLRAKRSVSETVGWALMPVLNVRYIFSTRIYLTFRLEYLYLTAEGKQNQSYYLPVAEGYYLPGWSARVESEMESRQLSISLGAGYSFEI